MSLRPLKKVKLDVPTKSKLTGKAKVLVKPDHDALNRQGTSKRKGQLPQEDSESQPKPSDKGKGREAESELHTSFKVVAGSYEKLLYGLDGNISVDDNGKLVFDLKPIFIFPAHVSCIKAVAASPQGGKWLATGSTDEIIKVWDLRRRKEIGGLMHHEGSITHLVFPSRSHLLSASEDGSLCLFRARDWAVLRSLKGHKGRVNAVAVHPSGKVALSVGKDRALRMWDLMRGKGVASTKLGKEGEIVRWSTDGSKFGVQFGSTIQIYATNMDLLWTIAHPSRIHDIKFLMIPDGSEVLLAGAEDKKITVYQLPKEPSDTPCIVNLMVGHTNRVKAIQTLAVALPVGSGRSSTTIVCTVSSDGCVNVYDAIDISISETVDIRSKEIQPVATYDSKGTRLTCLTLADGDPGSIFQNGKRKRHDEEGGSEGEDDGEDDDWGGIETQEELREGEKEDEGEEEEEEEV